MSAITGILLMHICDDMKEVKGDCDFTPLPSEFHLVTCARNKTNSENKPIIVFMAI